MEHNKDIKYTGFFLRFLAFLIDTLLVNGLISLVFVKSLESITASIYIVSITFILWWLYYAIMLSSPFRATLGKMVLGLEVVRDDFSTLSFLQASIRFIYFIVFYLIILIAFKISSTPILFIILLLPILVIFVNKRRKVLYDYFSKTIVIDKIKDDDKIKKIIRFIGLSIIIFSTLYSLAYIIVFYPMYTAKTKNYNNSFYTTYDAKEYNNSKIVFYKGELNRYTKDFIEVNSKNIYDIFEADVKRDLSLECIYYFVEKESNTTNSLDYLKTYRQNAINKYTNKNKDKINKAKVNVTFMNQNFYTFDSNIVSNVIDRTTDITQDKNISVCDKQIPIEILYESFLPIYISEFKSNNITNPYSNKISKREREWYKILENKFPYIIGTIHK